MEGIFSLTTLTDLFQKLEHDFSLMQMNPSDPYAAFNFFVTAEHMVDWKYPGYANKNNCKDFRKSNIILQICSHIANGAKHFVAQANHHKSVLDTSKKAVYGGGSLPSGSFPIGAIPKGGVPGK